MCSLGHLCGKQDESTECPCLFVCPPRTMTGAERASKHSLICGHVVSASVSGHLRRIAVSSSGPRGLKFAIVVIRILDGEMWSRQGESPWREANQEQNLLQCFRFVRFRQKENNRKNRSGRGISVATV